MRNVLEGGGRVGTGRCEKEGFKHERNNYNINYC